MTEQQEEYAYIGRAKCGCVVAAAVDEGDRATAKDVAEFIEAGLTVERVTVRYVRENWGCSHKPKQEDMAL